MTEPGAPEAQNGFAQKVLIVLLGAIMTILLGFFVWLATAVIDVRERTGRIEEKVTSLLDSRVVQEKKDAVQTTRRIEQLEDAAR